MLFPFFGMSGGYLCGMEQNRLGDEVVLRDIGPCPVCGKGRMIEGSAVWTCNHFRNWRDFCSFTVFRTYSGHVLTEEDAVALITGGHTEAMNLVTREGRPYRGVLRLSDGKVECVPQEDMAGTCPFCGGRVRRTSTGWMCERYFSHDSRCRLFIPGTILGRQVAQEEAMRLLDKGRTDVLDGFAYNGRTFSSCLVLDREKGCRVDGRICRCPVCGGDIYPGDRAYNCSNYREKEIRCGFFIWREIYGHRVTADEVRSLCSTGRTGLIGFHTARGGTMQRSLVMDENWKVRLV